MPRISIYSHCCRNAYSSTFGNWQTASVVESTLARLLSTTLPRMNSTKEFSLEFSQIESCNSSNQTSPLMSLTGTCWVEGCSFVRNGTRIKSFWCEFSENVCCNLTETREGFLSLEIFWKFFPNLPQFIKNWLQQRYFQGIFRNRILHSNFKCTPLPTF